MAKKLDDVAVKMDDRFERMSNMEGRLTKGAASLPTISPVVRPSPAKERRNSSLSMPQYVWDLLADAAHQSREPQNIFVMKALKEAGLAIAEEDLIDPRKTRNKK